MIKYNSNTINDWNFGDDNIIKVYRGVKAKPKHNYAEDYLTFVAETDNVSFTLYGGNSSNKLSYSIDDGTSWTELQIGQTSPAINSGDKILWKASGQTINSEAGIGCIRPSDSARVEGNVMSIIYGDDFSGQTAIQSKYQLRKLFSGATNLTSAENLVLPATTIKKQCYSQMFQGCTSLAKTPNVIGSSAMTLNGDYCLSDMFNSCTSLTTVPSGLLPATNLSTACYWYMFQNCTSLTNTPILPATTLTSYCYNGMFNGCSSLNTITCLATNPSTNYTNAWVSGVGSTGTFYKDSNANWPTGYHGIPSNWTVQNYVASEEQDESTDYVGVVVYYKVITSGSTPEYKVCYAVVDDISQYSETEYEDVFDKATEKWYKLNNLNEYEQYGVYASGRTSCSGGASRLPQGYTEVEYVQNNTQGAYLNLGVKLYETIGNSYQITARYKSQYMANWSSGEYLQTIINSEGVSSPYYGMVFRYAYSTHTLELAGGDKSDITWTNTDNGDGTSALTISSNSTAHADQVPLGLFASYQSNYTTPYRWSNATIYSMQITLNNELVRDLVPCIRDNDNMVGMYDLVNDVFYYPPNYQSYQLVAGDPVTPTDCVTTYEGKLTIDDGYEYEWNGTDWVNVGEVSGSSRLPVGYTEVEYVENTNNAYIDSNFTPNQDTRIVCDMQLVTQNSYGRLFGAGHWDESDGLNLNYEGGYLRISWFGKTTWTIFNNVPTNFNRHIYDLNKNNLYVDESLIGSNTYTTKTASNNLGLFCFIGKTGNPPTDSAEYFLGKLYSCQIYDNGTLVRNLVPCTNSSNVAGVYDIVNDAFYSSPVSSYQLSAGSSVAPPMVLPISYDEKSDPLDNLSFSSMTEAQAYAKANCVYDGMHATIDGDRYYFDSDDENGWVKIISYYKFEDITPNSASGWTITDSATYNPNSSYYDDFSVENNTTTNTTKLAKVTIYGYDSFTYYLRSYGYSTNVFVTSTNVDELQTDPTTYIGYTSSSAITNTYYWSKSPGADVNLSNYRRVTYNNLDKNVEHTFYVSFYGRTTSNYYANATILIPKEQTNENWEQVTFSASSNVASSSKNLYIDGNNSTSGGTNYFYYRWMVGLPSGSHSSYVNYTNYNYCPNVTSSTFTSVEGNSRLVEYTYDSTTNKVLQFRLVDESGNTINTGNTVYYNMSLFNSCNISTSSSNLTFPGNYTVKVGGKFYFTSSSNRHYIYGYQPNIQLSTYYYCDNYNTYFDIPYTKLSTEAVTVTYVTYDPNDVEVPTFSTKISYPYGNSGTSSTTLTSYEVPYTYTYDVSVSSNNFSADVQTFTASTSSRTVTLTLYPNNRTFSTIADMEAYQYAWEGMKATVDDTDYEYKNGEWTEFEATIWYDPNPTNGAENAVFNIGYYWGTNYKMVIRMYIDGTYSSDTGGFINYNQTSPIEFNLYSNGFYLDMHNPTSTTSATVDTRDYNVRTMAYSKFSGYQNSQIFNITLTYAKVTAVLESTGSQMFQTGSTYTVNDWYDGLYSCLIDNTYSGNRKYGHISSIKVYNANDELVNDLKFVRNKGVTGSQEISMYDAVLDVKYNNTTSYTPIYHYEE